MVGRNQIPNALTISRLLLGLVFPWLPSSLWLAALIWGTLSEFLDGFLARRFHAESAFGRLMDPIADKVFVLAAALTFLRTGWISWPELIFMASRDLFVAICSLVLLLAGRSAAFRTMYPARLGKWATAFQFATLFGVPILQADNAVLIYATGLISLAAAVDYARRFLAAAPACSNSASDRSKSR